MFSKQKWELLSFFQTNLLKVILIHDHAFSEAKEMIIFYRQIYELGREDLGAYTKDAH